MSIAIQPLDIPIIGTVDAISIQVNSFSLFPSSVQVFYMLSGPAASYNGNLMIPQEVVDVWGTDDTVVLDYVLS